jgi:hypothetical protein
MGKSKDQFMEMRDAETQDNYVALNKPLSNGLTINSNNLLKMDMATIETIARSIVAEVQEGNADAMDVLIYAKKGAAFFKAIDDNVKEYAYSKQYATKGVPYLAHSCKAESAELGVKYDYLSTNSVVCMELKQEADSAKRWLDDHEKFLKTIKGKLSVNNADTGEVMDINEPIKSGTMGYKISIF